MMKKWIALFMALVMVLSLVACKKSGNENKDKNSTATKAEPAPIVGDWAGEINMTELIGALLSEVHGIPFTFEDLTYSVVFTFNADGTYKSAVDEEDGTQIVNNLIDGIVNSLIAAGATETEEELREKINSQMDLGAFTESFISDYKAGYYVYKNNRIYMAEEDMNGKYEENAETVWEITLDSGTMVVEDMLDVEGNSGKDHSYGLLPIVLQNVN